VKYLSESGVEFVYPQVPAVGYAACFLLRTQIWDNERALASRHSSIYTDPGPVIPGPVREAVMRLCTAVEKYSQEIAAFGLLEVPQ
jgi:hypothetical protein